MKQNAEARGLAGSVKRIKSDAELYLVGTVSQIRPFLTLLDECIGQNMITSCDQIGEATTVMFPSRLFVIIPSNPVFHVSGKYSGDEFDAASTKSADKNI